MVAPQFRIKVCGLITLQISAMRPLHMLLLLGSFENNSKLDLDSVTVHLQVELIDSQCTADLKTKYIEAVIVKFHQQYVPADQFTLE